MDPRLRALLPLLILAHLSGVVRGHGLSQQKVAPKKNAPAKKPAAAAPRGTPQAQGGAGVSQGFRGSLAPITGGLGSMQNANGLLPHQQTQRNPFAMLGGVP